MTNIPDEQLSKTDARSIKTEQNFCHKQKSGASAKQKVSLAQEN